MTAFFKDTTIVPNYPSINKRPTNRNKFVTSATKLKDSSPPAKEMEEKPDKTENLQKAPELA